MSWLAYVSCQGRKEGIHIAKALLTCGGSSNELAVNVLEKELEAQGHVASAHRPD